MAASASFSVSDSLGETLAEAAAHAALDELGKGPFFLLALKDQRSSLIWSFYIILLVVDREVRAGRRLLLP